MTQRKRSKFLKVEKKNDLLENTFELSYWVPWLVIIRKNGFYWIHEKTIQEIGENYFRHLMAAHNMVIVKANKHLSLFKIKINGN